MDTHSCTHKHLFCFYPPGTLHWIYLLFKTKPSKMTSFWESVLLPKVCASTRSSQGQKCNEINTHTHINMKMLRRCQPRLTQSSLPSVTGRPAGDTAGPHAHTCARNCSLIMHKYTIAHLRCFLSCPYKKEHGWLHAQNKCGLIRHVKVEFKVKQLFVNAVIFFL